MSQIEVKKVAILTILIYLFFSVLSHVQASELLNMQSENIGLNTYMKEMQTYINSEYDININNIFNDLISGNNSNFSNKVLNNSLGILGNEVKENITLVAKIICIAIISSILNNLASNYGNSEVTQIGIFISYISVIVIVMSSFNNIIEIIIHSISTLNSFIYSLVPILFSLVFATGSITTSTVFQPIILFLITVIDVILTKIIVPITLVYTVINIVSDIGEKNQLSKLAGLIKSTTVWSLGLSLTLLVGVMSLEGSLSSSIDGVTGKTAKAAVTNFIPVVGKVLGDSVETVLGSLNILKNGLGVIVVIVIVTICLSPIIKIALLMGMYYLASAIIEPICDSKIIKCINHVGDSMKMLLAIITSISVMYIVAITLVVKISNLTISFR